MQGAMKSRIAAALTFALVAVLPAQAQDSDVPHWAAINVDEINMRVGPGRRYRIEWVYQRKGLPVRVLRSREGWRYVEDHEGTRGWFVRRMLTDQRHAVVTGEELAPIRAEPSGGAQLRWNAEPGVVGQLGECSDGWCQFAIGGRRGWIPADRIWGDGPP